MLKPSARGVRYRDLNKNQKRVWCAIRLCAEDIGTQLMYEREHPNCPEEEIATVFGEQPLMGKSREELSIELQARVQKRCKLEGIAMWPKFDEAKAAQSTEYVNSYFLELYTAGFMGAKEMWIVGEYYLHTELSKVVKKHYCSVLAGVPTKKD